MPGHTNSSMGLGNEVAESWSRFVAGLRDRWRFRWKPEVVQNPLHSLGFFDGKHRPSSTSGVGMINGRHFAAGPSIP